jgi:hypothetical protein
VPLRDMHADMCTCKCQDIDVHMHLICTHIYMMYILNLCIFSPSLSLKYTHAGTKKKIFFTTGKSVSVESAEVMQAPPLAPVRNMIEG